MTSAISSRLCKGRLLPSEEGKAWFPNGALALSEVMTIVILFQLSGYRCFKWFYQRDILGPQMRKYFPKAVSYNRFVELTRYILMPLTLYAKFSCLGRATGISFTDSTPLKVCHNRRIYSHKVFSGSAQRGKTSTGRFYGFKLHLVNNNPARNGGIVVLVR